MDRSANLVLVPARLQSTRLPGKVLAEISGTPMIVHVARRAVEADIGDVVVATDATEVHEAVTAAGLQAIMTRDDHPSGSDRIFEALQTIDPKKEIDTVVNLQGDLPTIEPEAVRAAVALLDDPQADIGTLAAVIRDVAEETDPHVTKVIGSPLDADRLRALYFTRATAPHGDGPRYHHIGLYAYRHDALSRFVTLPPSTLERRESLEQLRALEAGMRIDVALVDTVPLGVDTPADLERARQML